MNASTDGAVEHQPERKRFVLMLNGGEAELTYRQQAGTLIVDHTGVPAAFQHRGIANRLAEAALGFAREQQLRVVPECRFMAVYLKRHPEHRDLMVRPVPGV